MTTESQGQSRPRPPVAEQIRLLKMIHVAMVTGLIVFGGVILFIAGSRMTFDLSQRSPLVPVAAVLAAVNIGLAFALHRLFFKPGGVPPDPGNALERYRVFVLVRAALIEGAALFSAVTVMVSCSALAGCLFVLCALAMATFRPSAEEFADLVRRALAGRVKGAP